MSLYKIFPYDLDNLLVSPDENDFLMIADSQDSYRAKKISLASFILMLKAEFAVKADLATVAFSGNYNDLINKPNIYETVAGIVAGLMSDQFPLKTSLATVAFTGSYTDLIDKPNFDEMAMLYALIFG